MIPYSQKLATTLFLCFVSALQGQTHAPIPGVLELISGERLSGALAQNVDASTLAWHSSTFSSSLIYPTNVVRTVHFDASTGSEELPGTIRLTMVNGDRVSGSLLSIDETDLKLDTRAHGVITLPQTSVHSMMHHDAQLEVYSGPRAASQWQGRAKLDEVKRSWRNSQDGLESTEGVVPLAREGVILPKRSIRLTLSWTSTPSFRVGLGLGAEKAGDKASVWVETWGTGLVAFREQEQRIEMIELSARLPAAGTVNLKLEVSESEIRFLGSADQLLGTITRPSHSWSTLFVQNCGAEGFKFNSIQVSRIAEESEESDPVLGGMITGLLADQRLVLEDGREVPVIDAGEVVFSPLVGDEADGSPVIIDLQNGDVVSGRLLQLSEGAIHVETNWSKTPISIKGNFASKLSIFPKRVRPVSRTSRLVADGVTFLGSFAGYDPESGALIWDPGLAQVLVPLSMQAKGFTIIAQDESSFVVSRTQWPHIIQLHNRDVFPCRLLSMGPNELRVRVPGSVEELRVPAAAVKAIELDPVAVRGGVEDQRKQTVRPNRFEADFPGMNPRQNTAADRSYIGKERREQVLALPRKYKSRRPTHLIIAKNGDLMRGWLEELSSDALRFRTPTNRTFSLARNRIMAIVLLSKAPDESQPVGAPRYEFRLTKELRLSGTVTAADAQQVTISTSHFGLQKILMEDVEQILSGERSGKGMGFFSGWVLKDMKEPPQ